MDGAEWQIEGWYLAYNWNDINRCRVKVNIGHHELNYGVGLQVVQVKCL
jgi:hypothetical protein